MAWAEIDIAHIKNRFLYFLLTNTNPDKQETNKPPGLGIK